jgi:hypothetical protein
MQRNNYSEATKKKISSEKKFWRLEKNFFVCGGELWTEGQLTTPLVAASS